MKICFPVVNDEGMESRIYGHFGSAPRFLSVDMETGELTSFENNDQMAPEAGCNPFKALVGRQFDGIVVGGIGDGFLQVLHMLGIKVYQAESEHVAENIELFKQNALSQVEVQNSAEAGRCAGVEDGNHCGDHH
jgi:predicted Fe-Mo cluster-binding NifX family protein